MNNNPIKINKWLQPLSILYGLGVNIRNKLYDWGVKKSHRFQLPIICIGNLTVGGTGKTPHTEFLVEVLKKRYKVAILSRGYKRSTKGFILADENSSASSIGDEPMQIAQKFPQAYVAVAENRVEGVQKLSKLKEPPVEVVLLDDAFQHRRIKAGLNILLTDYNRLICDDALLPAGRLREPLYAKNRAHIVIVTKCPDTIKPIDFNIVSKRLDLYPFQKLYFSCFKYKDLRPISPTSQQKKISLSELKQDTKVLLVTGIANPYTIKKELSKYIASVEEIHYGDHHDFTATDLKFIEKSFSKIKGDKKLIITTEKDAMRLVENPHLSKELKEAIYALPIQVEILQNQENNFIQNILEYVREDKRDC